MAPPIRDAPVGTTGLGGAVRLPKTPYVFADEDRDLVPLYLYEGQTVFVHGTSVGAHAWRRDGLTVDVLGRFRFWELDPEQDERLAGLRERRQTVEGGLALTVHRGWGEFRVEWLTDLLDRHDGNEARLGYRYRFGLGPWSLSSYLTLSFLDDDMTEYYFGVREEESNASRPRYSPGRAMNLGYGINASRLITAHMEVFANIGVSEFDSTVFDSPLIDEALRTSALIGGNYYFGSTLPQRGVEPGPRSGEWSWRMNFGYQAQGNIVGEIDRGDFRRSVEADTRIAGVTVSKLLNEGERADYYGRFALFRHLEGSGQENFFSIAAYVAAMGKGYFPWSEKPAFRWSFGMGLSYAQEVPLIEQIKQTRKGENTARFLNYLEMSIDFPLRNLTRGERFDDCFVGLTTVHRSGIFGNSDLLGGVAGGSDWLTMHWECLR